MPESVKYYFFGFVIALVLLGLFILLLSILYSQKQTKNKNERLKLQSQFSQTLLQSQLEIQEQTLRHISHELHDNLGQVASLIKINLNTLQLHDTVKATEKIEHTKELTRQLIGDLKSLSVSLGSERIAQTGLVKALQTEVERLNKTEQFKAVFLQEGKMPVVNNDKAIILYRMAQEALNNTVKHSGAKHINILLNTRENLFTLAIHDDGVGFNVNEKLNSGGAGLTNLQNRAGLINAQLTMQSTPGNGTKISIELHL
jgi:signal transduction histidine kinase